MHGNICLDILQDKWSAVYDVRATLLSLRSLLGEPNNDSPLNALAASLWGKVLPYFNCSTTLPAHSPRSQHARAAQPDIGGDDEQDDGEFQKHVLKKHAEGNTQNANPNR